MQGKVEGKRRRGRPATTWFQDLKEWTKLDIAGASQLATDWERWRKIIKVTTVQIAPPDRQTRERLGAYIKLEFPMMCLQQYLSIAQKWII